MLSVHCPRHASQVLLSERHVLAIEPVGDGLRVRWECWCGHRGSHLTGRPRRTAPAARVA